MNTRRILTLVFSTVLFFSFSSTSLRAEETAAPVKPKKAKTAKKKRVLKSAPATVKPATAETTAAPGQTKPAQRDNLSAWLKDLKKRLVRSQARQNQIVAVAAVRGNETPDSPPLYWKGKKTAGEVQTSELKQFEDAIDQALEGKSEESMQKLQAFVTNYPDSPMVADAQEALKKLEEPTAQ